VIRRSRVAVLLAAVLLTTGGCSSSDPAPPRTLHPRWREATLPFPPGKPGRIAVRDATTCGRTWYVVGAILGDAGASRPAAWTSTDGRSWRSVATAATDYYARRAILYSVACRDGEAVVIGAKSGGAHGNPRTATWQLGRDGVLHDVAAPFVLYGGAAAVSVDRVAAGPDGWLIAGNRRSGGAVWWSAATAGFRLVDDDPELSSDAELRTTAVDPVGDSAGWTVVGRAEAPGRTTPVPLAWVSPDGRRWTRQQVPSDSAGFADLERVARDDDDLLAVGIRGDRFGSWRRTGGRWRATESFGALDPDGTGARFVSGLAIASGVALATACDGGAFRLWRATDGSWRPVATPVRPKSTADDLMTVTSDADTVLLLADDGRSGRVWWAEPSSFVR
jgi:hypothetical protein